MYKILNFKKFNENHVIDSHATETDNIINKNIEEITSRDTNITVDDNELCSDLTVDELAKISKNNESSSDITMAELVDKIEKTSTDLTGEDIHLFKQTLKSTDIEPTSDFDYAKIDTMAEFSKKTM